jgi:hypothetical protein
MSPSVLAAVEKVLGAYHPRFFQGDSQATQYTNNLGHKKPGRFGGGKGFARLQADFDNANQDLRDGKIDEPSTKRFVDMMDASMQETPEDLIINHVATADAFGLTSDRLPELEELTGDVIADRGYLATNLGTPAAGGQGIVQMRIAAPKGTRVAIPASSGTNRAIFIDRDQELTITKVKPDGRGGYIMSVVATPKTPGETPLPEAGHQGSGMPADREANIKGLEDAASKRETGSQPLGALPGEAAETPPAGMTPEQVRAQRRAAVLGRGPATAPQAQQPSAGPAPAGAPAEPATPAAPNVSAPAPAETPQTPSTPESPNGATSVVTGDPATSFRDAVSSANLEAPSNGPRRKEWNSAYMGITSGKQQPADMLRELESDISTNKELQKTETGRGDSLLARDIEKQEQLADLIRSHFTLGEPKKREARADVRNELDTKASAAAKKALTRPGGGTEKAPPGKKTAAEAARPGPLAKVAPKRTDGTSESRGKDLSTQQTKDAEDDRLNAEQRARWSDAVGAEPASMKSGDTAGNILLDETADLLRNGRVTRPKAVQRLRDQAKDDDTPEANYLRKIADTIEADESKPAKRVPLKKRAPKAAPDTEAAEKKLEGRTEKNILTGLNGLTVGDLRALAEKWGVETRGEDKKLKLKAALSKELAAKWKATPSLQRKGSAAKEDVAADLKKAAPAKLAAPAKRAAAPKVLSDEESLARAQKTLDNMGSGAPIRRPAPSKLGPATAADDAALAKAQKTIDNLGKKATPEVKALKAIEVAPDTPPVLAKAAKAAAREAEIAAAFKTHQERLSDPNKKTVSASRLKVGEKLLAQRNEDGTWDSSARKTGAKTLTVTKIDRATVGRQSGYLIHGTDEDGNEITLRPQTGQNVVNRALGTPAKKAAPPETPAAAPVPEAPKVPGIDTAERARLQDRARAALAQMQAEQNNTDVLDEMEKLLPGDKNNARDLVKMAKEVRAEVEATSGPSKISVDDRVAARMLARVKPEYRQGLLDSMDPKDRKHLLDVAERVATEAERVKKSGASLDKIMSDAGIKRPSGGPAALDYAQVEHLLGQGKVAEARGELKRLLDRSDNSLKSYRAGLEAPGQTQANKEFLGKRITEELERAQWIQSAAAALHSGDSPELVTKKEVIQVVDPELGKVSVARIKADAKAAGIKLPEAATTKDEVLTELAREMIRRQQAGNPIDLTPPAPLPKKKAAPKPPAAKIDARTLVPDQAYAEAPGSVGNDKNMLDRIQRLLDGDTEALRESGLPKDATPAAIGRWLDSWSRGAGSPGYAAATNTILVDGAKRRLKNSVTPEDIAIARAELADAEANTQMYRAQSARWKALAEALKKTRRTRATPAAKADVETELRQMTPTEAVEAGISQVEIVRGQLPMKRVPKKVSKAVQSNLSPLADDDLKKITESPQFGDDQKATVAAELARRTAAKKATVPVKETLARAAKSTPVKKAVPSTVVTDTEKEVREAESRLARLQDRLDSPDLDENTRGQIEDDIDTARDERDTARENLQDAQAAVKKAAKKAAPGVEAQVEVKREVAAAKKVAKAAKPSTGGSMTREELMDAPLGDLVDMEIDLGIRRGSLLKADRVDAIMKAREAAAEPVKVKTAKAVKSVEPSAPTPPTKKAGAPVQPVYQAGDDNGRIKIIKRTKEDTPLVLPNGGSDQGLFHLDSSLGKLWGDLYNDQREPNSFINEIANAGNSMGRDEQSLNQVIARLEKLKGQASDSGIADRVQEAIDGMNAPEVKVPKIEGVPPAIQRFLEELADIPTARKTGRIGASQRKTSVLDDKIQIIRDIQAGKLRSEEAERKLKNRDLHESADAAHKMWKLAEQLLIRQIQKAQGGKLVETPNPNYKEVIDWIREHDPRRK